MIAWIQRGLPLVVVALALIGCGSTSTSSSEQPEARDVGSTPSPAAPAAIPATPAPADVAPAAPAGSALAAVDSLVVKGRAPKTGYAREQFGEAWHDADHNGCDTRNDILARDLTGVQRRAGSDCVVVAGVLHDPYTGRDISFTKENASAVQIDHVVALSDSWQKGSVYWDRSKRVALANDPLILANHASCHLFSAMMDGQQAGASPRMRVVPGGESRARHKRTSIVRSTCS